MFPPTLPISMSPRSREDEIEMGLGRVCFGRNHSCDGKDKKAEGTFSVISVIVAVGGAPMGAAHKLAV